MAVDVKRHTLDLMNRVVSEAPRVAERMYASRSSLEIYWSPVYKEPEHDIPPLSADGSEEPEHETAHRSVGWFRRDSKTRKLRAMVWIFDGLVPVKDPVVEPNGVEPLDIVVSAKTSTDESVHRPPMWRLEASLWSAMAYFGGEYVMLVTRIVSGEARLTRAVEFPRFSLVGSAERDHWIEAARGYVLACDLVTTLVPKMWLLEGEADHIGDMVGMIRDPSKAFLADQAALERASGKR